MLLMQKIVKTDAVQGLFDLCPHFCPNHTRNAIISLVAVAGIAGLQTVGQRDRTFQGPYDISDGQFRGLSRQQVSTGRPADAVDHAARNTGGEEGDPVDQSCGFAAGGAAGDEF